MTNKDYVYYFRVILGAEKGFKASLIRIILRCASFLYGLIVRTRNLLYSLGIKKAARVNCPVISVGNLTAGGTGKTPMVEYLAGRFSEKGVKVAVLSRGYKQTAVPQEDDSKLYMNDEALALADKFPDLLHFQSPDRVTAARKAVFDHDVHAILLDDGFQHRRLARDLDIVLIDALSPFGLGYILPRGLLREPISSLKRADVAVITRCDLIKIERVEIIKKRLSADFPELLIAESEHRLVGIVGLSGENAKEPTWLAGKKVYLMCAVGNPTGFQKSVERLGAETVGIGLFPDHFIYTSEHVAENREKAAAAGAEIILVTHKDAVKLRKLPKTDGLPIKVAMMELKITAGLDAFIGAVDRAAGIGV